MTQANEKSVCQCDADWTDGTPYCQQCGLERAPSVEPAQPQTTMQSFAKEMTEYDFEPSLELDKEQIRRRSEPAAEGRMDEDEESKFEHLIKLMESQVRPITWREAAAWAWNSAIAWQAARASGTGQDRCEHGVLAADHCCECGHPAEVTQVNAKAQLISKDAASINSAPPKEK